MRALDQDAADELRDKMIEELLAKTEKGTSTAHGVFWTSCVRAVSSWMLSGSVRVLCACVCAGPKSGDMMTRKRAKLSSKDERPKKKTNGQSRTHRSQKRMSDGRMNWNAHAVGRHRRRSARCAIWRFCAVQSRAFVTR